MKFNKENMPKSIAIIMDGNRRWAKAQGKPVSFGHKEGAKTLEKIVRYANKIGLEYITVYAFSTENWKRAEDEVKTLMLLLQAYLDDYAKRADSENIKVKILGDITALSKGMQKSIRECMERTKNNTGVTFNIALNYGGRDEIVKATRKIAEQVKQGKIDVDEINEKMVLVDFFAKWCGPCRMISPIVEELSNEINYVSFCKVDVDESGEIANTFGVLSIPTLLLFKEGKLISKKVGFQSKDELTSWINENK